MKPETRTRSNTEPAPTGLVITNPAPARKVRAFGCVQVVLIAVRGQLCSGPATPWCCRRKDACAKTPAACSCRHEFAHSTTSNGLVTCRVKSSILALKHMRICWFFCGPDGCLCSVSVLAKEWHIKLLARLDDEQTPVKIVGGQGFPCGIVFDNAIINY